MLANQTLHRHVPWMNSENSNAGNYFMLLRSVAMVIMAMYGRCRTTPISKLMSPKTFAW